MDSKLLEKIQKLLNHADGTDNESEQAAFLEKAQRLMQEYAITQAMLEAHTAEGVDEIVTIDVIIPKHNPLTNGKRDLLGACALNNRCQTWYKSGTHANYIVGYKSDAEYAVLLYTHLLNQMEWEMLMAQAELDRDDSVRTFKANFSMAYSMRVNARLAAMNEKIKPDDSTDEGKSQALVLVGRSEAVDLWVDDNLKLSAAGKRKLNSDAYASSAGRAAGDRADIAGARGRTERIES